MEPEETLLPLHRQFTEKERIALLKQRLKAADIRNDSLRKTINKLEKQVFELKQKMKDEPPDTFGGSKTVSAKAYNKLMKTRKMWEVRFWETREELEKLKL